MRANETRKCQAEQVFRKARRSSSLFGPILRLEIDGSRLHERAVSVWLHHLVLEHGTVSDVARGQVYRGLRLLLLLVRLVIQPLHLLPLAHFKHLVLWRAHLWHRERGKMSKQGARSVCLTNTYVVGLRLVLAASFLRRARRLELLDLSVDVVDLRAHVVDHLAL